MLGTHYRNMIEWSEERVERAARALEPFSRLLRGRHRGAPRRPGGRLAFGLRRVPPRFERAMDDDFNTPQALAALFDFVRALADARDRGPAATPRARSWRASRVRQLARVLGLFSRAAATEGPPAEVEVLVRRARRRRARRRDFKRSDELRDEIGRLGWLVEDTAAGPRLTPKGP